MITHFAPQPRKEELPRALASPFSIHGPGLLSRRAATQLQPRLATSFPHHGFEEPDGGKMFGVLVVADPTGRIGYLSGFSGMVGQSWSVEGFAPPLFDQAKRDSFWIEGELALNRLGARIDELTRSPALRAATAWRLGLTERHEAERLALAKRHGERRAQRKAERALLGGPSGEPIVEALHWLAQQSRGDRAQVRALKTRHRGELAALERDQDGPEHELLRLREQRAAMSRQFLRLLHGTYSLPSAAGHTRPIAELFSPNEPPGGAGDCAGPKLFGWAYQLGLRPLELAEFWWGHSSATGDRHHGNYYPSCRGKCGPVLAHMLTGLAVMDEPLVGENPTGAEGLQVLFEDECLLVINKPAGLLSVPGRNPRLHDSVLTRAQERMPTATGPIIVHRLDAEVSGIMVLTKTREAHAALQASFASRSIDKRYRAWVEGSVVSETGDIKLPLRVDLDDRPRQIVDAVNGKAAHTSWRVLERSANRTLLELRPHSGRSHQLRVHAAHPDGLAAPIVGDRLYGQPGERLCLQAQSIEFLHPLTARPTFFALARADRLPFTKPETAMGSHRVSVPMLG